MSKPAWAIGARQGPLRRHKRIVFFACEGLVAVFDEREQDEEYVVITPSDFKERAVGVGQMGRKMAKDERKWMRTEGQEMRRSANDMLETVREARAMGDPSDPAVQAYWARHRTNRTIKVSLSAGSDEAGYPELPKVDLGKFTGRTAEADDPFETAGAVLVGGEDDPNRIRATPRKKKRGLLLP